MENFENEQPEIEIKAAIERFEEMLRRNKRYFFDQNVLIQIIDYFISIDDTNKAHEAANLAVEQYPFSIETWLKKSQILTEEGKYEAALKVLDKAESLDPNDINILLMRSDCLLLLDKFQQAVDVLQTGLEQADENEKDLFYLEIADVYFEWDEFEKAFDNVVKSLKANPTNEYALNRIWFLAEATQRYEESVALHQSIIDEHPFCYAAWTNLSQAYSGLDLFEKALECCEYAIAINDKIDMAYRDAGEIYVALKKYKDALEHFNTVATLVVPDAFLLFNIGLCHEKMKDYAAARNYYQRCIQANKNFSDGYFQIAETYAKEHEWKKAIPFYRTAAKLNENYLPYRAKLAKAMMMSGYNREAGKLFVDLLEHNPRKKTWWQNLIKIFLELERVEDAFFAYNQAISYLGKADDFNFIAVAIYWASGEQNSALLALDNALTQSSHRYKTMFDVYPAMAKEPKVLNIIANYKKKK